MAVLILVKGISVSICWGLSHEKFQLPQLLSNESGRGTCMNVKCEWWYFEHYVFVFCIALVNKCCNWNLCVCRHLSNITAGNEISWAITNYILKEPVSIPLLSIPQKCLHLTCSCQTLTILSYGHQSQSRTSPSARHPGLLRYSRVPLKSGPTLHDFCIWYDNDWGKICIGVYIHKRQIKVFCDDLGKNSLTKSAMDSLERSFSNMKHNLYLHR